MSTTSKIRRGIATVGASALTFGVFAAVAPAAFANTVPQAFQVTVTPPSQTGTANTDCLAYTATASTQSNAPAVGTLNVILSEAPSTPAAQVNNTESFCTTGAPPPANPGGVGTNVAGAPAGTTEHQFTTNANGQITFGVFDPDPETIDIRAFDDVNGNGTADANEATTSTGTPPTAVFVTATTSTGNNSVHALNAVPANVNARPGDTAVYLVTATTGGASPSPVDLATVNFVITAGPDTTNVPQPCDADTGSGNNDPRTGPGGAGTATAHGQSYCRVLTHAAGQDSITFYVNQSNVALPTNGPDSGEPTATATLTDLGAAPAGDTINVLCTTQGAATNFGADPSTGQHVKACHDFTTRANGAGPVAGEIQDTFLATVTDPSANLNVIQGGAFTNGLNQTNPTPKNVTVNWTISGGSATASVTGDTPPNSQSVCDPTENQTASGGTNGNGGGECTGTLTEPAPTNGETITVTGTIAGETPATSSSATKDFQVRPLGARNITLTPPSQNGVSGTGRTVTALVTDVNGTPVPNVQVTFSTTGVGHFTSNGIFGTNQQYVTTTGPNGSVQAQVQTNGDEQGTETISVTISQNGTQCTDQAGFVGGQPNPAAKAGNCSATSTVAWSQTGGTGGSKRLVVNLHLSCFSNHKHSVTCNAQLSKAISGVTVVLHDSNGQVVGTDKTNSSGKAVFHLHHLKSHHKHHYRAHAKTSSKTRSADSNTVGIRVK